MNHHNVPRRILRAGILLLALLIVTLPLLAAPADLDLTWDQDGVVTTPPFSQYRSFVRAFQLPSGKVIGIGDDPEAPEWQMTLVARYLDNGKLDTTFGNQGVASVGPWSTEYVDFAVDAALQADDKLVIGLISVQAPYGDPLIWHIAIKRVNADGSLDTTFGNGGRIAIDAHLLTIGETGESRIKSIAVQPDGKIIIIGFIASRPGGTVVVRLNTDGTLDENFANNGLFYLQAPDIWFSLPYQAIIQSDGKIVVAGYSATDYSTNCGPDNLRALMFRLNSNGTLDPSFGSNGLVRFLPYALEIGIAEYNVIVKGMILQPDGKFVVNGTTYACDPDLQARKQPTGFISRVNPNGSLDSTFDGNGVVLVNIDNDKTELLNATLQANGKILINGTKGNSLEYPLIARFNNDGTLDTSWNGSGYLTTSGPYKPFNLSLQADGKILGTSEILGGFPGHNYITRHLGDPAFGYTALVPAHLSTDISPDANLTLTFAQPVTINTGEIEIRRVDNFALVESIPVTDAAQVTGSGTTSITINPNAILDGYTQYFVTVDSDTFRNANGDSFSGVRELTRWHFTTGEPLPNQPPILTSIGDQTITAGQTLSFTAAATDPEIGQTLSYSLSGAIPDGTSIHPETGDFTWMPTEAQIGTHEFDVVVTDNGTPNLSDFETITVTVEASPIPPENLLTNGGFEIGRAEKHNRPQAWIIKNPTIYDGRACNKVGRPNGKPDKIVAKVEKCAYRFTSAASQPRRIEQTIDLTEAITADSLRLIAWTKGKALTKGAKFRVDVAYADSSREKHILKVRAGTYDYELLMLDIPLSGIPTQARIRILTGASTGTLWLDDLQLTEAASTAILPLPSIPRNLRGNYDLI